MDRIIRWGVLSTAKIGRTKVIPAIQKAEGCVVEAIASRDGARAAAVAAELGIPRSFSSYEELLADPGIDAVYIPLPNHMHVHWMKKCLEAGKHVLCEKPMALHADEINELISLRDETGLSAGEAFMVLHHPRWKRVKELVNSGEVGTVRHIDGFFSFYNPDPGNIRNKPDYGGGSSYDIGVYPVVTMRMVLGEEPVRLVAKGVIDPELGIDSVTSVIMEFPSCTASFTCSMQISGYQQMRIYGETGVLTLDTPFNAPNDRELTISKLTGILPEDMGVLETFGTCDQYTLQAEAFRQSILEGMPFAGALEHARKNQRVIDAIYRSIKSGFWELV